MKLRNKKTGEIDEFLFEVIKDRIDLYRRVGYSENKNIWHYDSLAELNEEWEDYIEEPKYYYFITWCGNVDVETDDGFDVDNQCREIGNYFETKEEAEKAVEKLKAWKRLKDKGFEFTEWYKPDGCEPFIVIETNIGYDDVDNKLLQKDLDLLFGGEE